MKGFKAIILTIGFIGVLLIIAGGALQSYPDLFENPMVSGVIFSMIFIIAIKLIVNVFDCVKNETPDVQKKYQIRRDDFGVINCRCLTDEKLKDAIKEHGITRNFSEDFLKTIAKLEKEKQELIEWLMRMKEHSRKLSYNNKKNSYASMCWGAFGDAFGMVQAKIQGQEVGENIDDCFKNFEIESSEKETVEKVKELLKPQDDYNGLEIKEIYIDELSEFDDLTCPECGEDLKPYEPEKGDRFAECGFDYICPECETLWRNIDHIKKRKQELDKAGMRAEKPKEKKKNVQKKKTKKKSKNR